MQARHSVRHSRNESFLRMTRQQHSYVGRHQCLSMTDGVSSQGGLFLLDSGWSLSGHRDRASTCWLSEDV